MQEYLNQESRVRPQEIQFANGFIRVNRNIAEKKGIKDGVEYIYYTFDSYDYTQAEYNEYINKQVKQQWDTLTYLLKQTGDIPQQVI